MVAEEPPKPEAYFLYIEDFGGFSAAEDGPKLRVRIGSYSDASPYFDSQGDRITIQLDRVTIDREPEDETFRIEPAPGTRVIDH